MFKQQLFSFILLSLLSVFNIQAQASYPLLTVDSLEYIGNPVIVDSDVSYYYFEKQYPFTLKVDVRNPEYSILVCTMSLSTKDKVLYLDVYNYMLTSELAGDVYRITYKVISR